MNMTSNFQDEPKPTGLCSFALFLFFLQALPSGLEMLKLPQCAKNNHIETIIRNSRYHDVG